MADIELVIKIDKDIYEARQHWVANPKRMVDEVDIAIANGIPLPKGRGRLIDADALENYIKEDADEWDEYALAYVEDAPTIIEADREG